METLMRKCEALRIVRELLLEDGDYRDWTYTAVRMGNPDSRWWAVEIRDEHGNFVDYYPV